MKPVTIATKWHSLLAHQINFACLILKMGQGNHFIWGYNKVYGKIFKLLKFGKKKVYGSL